MHTFFFISSLIIIFNVSLAVYPFTKYDQDLYNALFQRDLQKGKDLQNYVYPLLGMKEFDNLYKLDSKYCPFIEDALKNELESIQKYYFQSLLAKNSPCQLPFSANVQAFLEQELKDPKQTNMKLYQIHEALSKKDAFSEIVYNSMKNNLKNNPSINDYAFILKFVLDNPKFRDNKFIEETIKALLKQADEIDNKYIQFSGGIAISSLIVDTVYKLTQELSLHNYLTDNISIKLVNYLLDKKYQTISKNAYFLYQAIKTISENKINEPVVITFITDSAFTINAKHPSQKFSVTNMLGHSLSRDKPIEITGKIIEESTGKTLKTIGKFVPITLTNTETFGISANEKNAWYQTDLKGLNLPAGVAYTLSLDVKPPASSTGANDNVSHTPKKYIGTTQTMNFNVARDVVLKDPILTTIDDHGNTKKYNLPADRHKLNELIKLLPNHKLTVTFAIQDATTKEDVLVQQAFFRFQPNLPATAKGLKHEQTEIMYVAENKANSKAYEFDLVLDAKRAKEFDQLSGDYTLQMIIGDQFISNPINWAIADFKLNFPGSLATLGENVKDPDARYKKKPEIQHTFKIPEKRPPKIVSLVFSGLVLLPLLGLFILWTRIGFNFKRFPYSIWALVFHGTLAATFVLYGMFWLKLNMFQTMRYLALLSPIMFFSGNRLLRSLASHQSKKEH